MKTLFLVHHAEPLYEMISGDYDRPLSVEGEKELLIMASALQRREGPVDRVVSSPFKHAWDTAVGIAEALDSVLKLEHHNLLFSASVSTIMHVINHLNEESERVVIVGHNPGIWKTIKYLSGVSVRKNYGEIVKLKVSSNTWKEVSEGCAEVEYVDAPILHAV